MQQIYQFFRLIRFSNLLVIGMTMCFFYGLLSNYYLNRLYLLSEVAVPNELLQFSWLDRVGITDVNFMLLILSVTLVAASGNIINDYFDQKADRINKPNRLIIGKFIKRRWAIILNWSFNGIALLIALYLSVTFSNWWIVFVSFSSINLLYFYSAVYKRKFLTGNLIVAFLTAIVPFYVFIYGGFSNFQGASPFGPNDLIFIADNMIAVLGYCAFAFTLNLIREIIKDMADVKGDLLLKSKTIPIAIGFKKTKYLIIALFVLALSPLAYYVITKLVANSFIPSARVFIYALAIVVLLLAAAAFITLTKKRSKDYLNASNLIKLAMLFGIISALFYS